MITSLTIENYRVFRHFTLDDIARVNLVVGTNNAGKSSLLEAVHLLMSQSPSQSLLHILEERGERTVRTVDSRLEPRPISGYLLAHIFTGHAVDPNVEIHVAASHGIDTTHLRIAARNLRQADGTQVPLFEDDMVAAQDSRARNLVFERTSADPEHTTNEVLRVRDGIITARVYPRTKDESRLVTTNVLAYDDLSELWDSITLTPREDQVVAALQVVEPDLDRISFTSRQQLRSGVLIKLRSQPEPVPLSSMGDGMRRVLAIVASLVSVDGGTLLVDEIDTGLHYSVLYDMWRLIFMIAQRSKTQVFATTHSFDCVRAFQQALHEHEIAGAGRVIRLDKHEDTVVATSYVAHELDIAVDQGIEVR